MNRAMKDLSGFKQFAIKSKRKTHNKQGKAVIYTRVSTKEQAENNQSLETQRKYCKQLAEKKGIDVIEYFGGTYESAKSDERKEFTKMLSFVKRNKSVSYIIVYSYDRFSRTGANGAYISDQLKKQGVITLSATQEIDVDSASGSFQQNLYYMFSQFDNELRRDKSVSGMQEKLRKGYWIGTIPFGYTNLNPGKGKEQKIIINKDGKLLRQAFLWKARENITYTEIAERLAKKGLHIQSKKLSDFFRNPFYCGIVVSGHIAEEVIEGKHEGLVSKEVFLKINEILSQNASGYKHNSDDENLPLKQFVKSADCKTPYTGYVVKKKGLYYYKNNRIGAKENKSAKVMHEKFKDLLRKYQIQIQDNKYIPVLIDMLKQVFNEQNKELLEEVELQKKSVKEINQKLERLEERFVFEEISSEQYGKFKSRLEKERLELNEGLNKRGSLNLSNLENLIEKATKYALNLSNLWSSGTLETKRAIQNMMFPEGILFDFKNDTYRTIRVNSIFSLISRLSLCFNENKNGTNQNKFDLSRLVPGMGLEPTRLLTHAPQACLSTNFSTRVKFF